MANFLKALFVFPLLVGLMLNCARTPEVVTRPEAPVKHKSPTRIGYAVQVGAFSKAANAVRLSQTLQDRGVEAYYFRHGTGLYKVRFGDFRAKEKARRRAESLFGSGVIEDFYVVGPEDYPAVGVRLESPSDLRDEIVITAETFLGLPYRFGGTSPRDGFDCSGLSMAVYHLNGLSLPRTSRQQWSTGSPVNRSKLSKGDLVFFATQRGRRVSHVGIYVGGDRFIHAPNRGKRIRFDSLSSGYYRRRYLGARNYL
jgi:cell wall-associated NlpC family hydrolase